MAAPAAAFDDSLDQFLEKHPGQTEEEYLAAWEERWNKRIDKEVVTLGEGFGKIMDALEVSSENITRRRRHLTDVVLRREDSSRKRTSRNQHTFKLISSPRRSSTAQHHSSRLHINSSSWCFFRIRKPSNSIRKRRGKSSRRR